MKFSTLFKMDYDWAYRYPRKRLYQRLRFLKRPAHYDVTVSWLTVRLQFTTPYHHSIAQSQGTGQWEELELLKDWIEYAKTSSIIFDVGGYNGIYGLFAKKANPAAKVYIFEPDPVSADHIRMNQRVNGLTIHLIQKAATDHEGIINFSGDGSSGSRVTEWGTPMGATMLRSYGAPDLLKIDIEGHEPEALKGADISKVRALFIEMNHPIDIEFREIKRIGKTAILIP